MSNTKYKFMDVGTWRPLIYPDGFKHTVKMTNKIHNEFVELQKNNPNIIPYQSIDMMKLGTVRYTDKTTYQEFISQKNKYNSYKKNYQSKYPFDLSSDIDLFKMNRPKNKFTYLYEIDSHVTKHQNDIVTVINHLNTSNKIQFTFIPYIPNALISELDISKIEQHNRYKSINILKNEEFVAYLKSIVSVNKIGEVIDSINELLYAYDTMVSTLGAISGKSVTNDNLVDIIMDIQQKKIYGLDKKTISKRLQDRNKLLNDYAKTAKTDCNSDPMRQELYKYLSELPKLELNEREEHIIKEIQNCNSGELELNNLIYNIGNNDEENYSTCKNMAFSTEDIFAKKLFHNSCRQYVKEIGNLNDDILHPTVEIGTDKSKCSVIRDVDSPKFEFHSEYMPEWLYAINENKLDEAFKHRQLLLGDTDATYFFKRCSAIVRSDPFISKSCRLHGIHHDSDWNKVVVSCIMGSDDIFPIRLVDGKLIEESRLYEPFNFCASDKLIGSLILPVKGDRTKNEIRYYVMYIYLNTETRFIIKPVDFRANILLPGSIVEHNRMLYLEMNTLAYYNQDINPGDKSNLHFYKLPIGEGFDILVSKYDKEYIKKKYNEYKFDINHIDKLIEVKLIKTIDKRFIFEEIAEVKQIGGKNNSEDQVSFSFKCVDYKWDIKYENVTKLINENIYPVSLHNILQKSIKYFSSIIKKDIGDVQCDNVREYYRGPTVNAIEVYNPLGLNVENQSNKLKKYLENISLKKNQFILAYKFETTLSYYTYILIKKFNLYNNGDKITILSANNFILDGILYYLKYTNFKYNKNDLTVFLYTYRKNIQKSVYDYINNHNVNYINITDPLTNENINKYTKNIKEINIGIVDLIINIPGINFIRNGYIFQTYYSGIICILTKLKKGGTLIVNTSLISNEIIFNFMIYLACHFDQNFIYEIPDIDIRPVGLLLVSSIIVFKGYRGSIDMDKLLEVNKSNYLYDPTGGFRYEISDLDEKKIFANTYKSPNPPEKYLKSIFKISNADTMYIKYKSYVKSKLFDLLTHLTNEYNYFLNKPNLKQSPNICDLTRMKSIYLAKKYDLPLVDWIDKTPSEYFDYIVGSYIDNINFTKQYILDYHPVKININKFDTVTAPYYSNLKKNYELSELAYQYTEKIDMHKYKSIELFINNKYKKLNELLYNNYDVEINNKIPSRAWVKMYELLSDTKFLDKFNKQTVLKSLHICEAPGNFINSIIYYIKRNTQIKSYNWTAQSLSSELADFYDSYGFIKQTKNQWDLGPKKSGDITDYENFTYYYETYGSKVDILVSDCGEKWVLSAETDVSDDISLFQMLYAILFPKTGGNFIIKSYSTNHNLLYLSLLYTACHFYDKIITFKSNTNFWSPEIYIIGIGKKPMSKSDIDTFLSIVYNLTKNKIQYPIDDLPTDFCMMYEKIMYNYVSEYTDIKKFFVFLSKNEELFNSNKDKLSNIIDKKNKEWINKYMKK